MRTLRNKILAVFRHYQKHHPQSFRRPKEGTKEWRLIRDRFTEGFELKELKQAIDGCHMCPWNCGINPQRRRYLDLSLIMRSGSHVTRFCEEVLIQTGRRLRPETHRTLQAVADWSGSTEQPSNDEDDSISESPSQLSLLPSEPSSTLPTSTSTGSPSETSSPNVFAMRSSGR